MHGGGGKSALGVKRTIANRLETLTSAGGIQERKAIVKEVEDLVWHLYKNLKTGQQKFQSIRKILDK